MSEAAEVLGLSQTQIIWILFFLFALVLMVAFTSKNTEAFFGNVTAVIRGR
ncbi:MAG: hypothetical protein V1802_02390 [Candidatus Aenigmatarchaeota archaeon]